MHRVTACRASEDYRRWVRFCDGVEGGIFLGRLLEVGSFDCWHDFSRFCVAVDPAAETVFLERGNTA